MIPVVMMAQTAGASAAPPAPILDTIASNVIDLDATLSASYDGSSQFWQNYCTTPADGSAKALFDMQRGDTSSASATDPTFNGSAGSPAAYFSLDGGDYFSLKSGVGGPNFIKQLHQEGLAINGVTLAMAFRYVDSGAAQNLAGNNSSGSTGNAGFRWGISSGDLENFMRNTGAASNSNNTVTSALTLVNGTDYLIALTYDRLAATRAVKMSINGATFTAQTAPGALAGNIVDSDKLFTIGSSRGASGTMASGTRIYAFSAFNSVLSDAELAALAAIYETRHARDYTTQASNIYVTCQIGRWINLQRSFYARIVTRRK